MSQPSQQTQKIFAVGTLRYTTGGLVVLFSWIMWNDLCLMLMEHVAPTIVPLMMKDHGASNKEIAFFTASLTGIFTIWVNPLISVWSDRHRSPHGRRRPFLFLATPFCAIALAAIPFMPDLFHFLAGIPAFSEFLHKHSTFGIILLIGVCYLIFQEFNNVILAVYHPYFYDVVPVEVMGRFQALVKVVTALAGFIWNFALLGLAQDHLKEVFVWVAVFFLVSYLVSLWQVKEGEYPPPTKEKIPGIRGVVASFFTDCFRPYYLPFIIANSLFQIGNVANGFQIFLFRDQLGLDLNTIGKVRAIPTLLVVVVGYFMGSIVDRFKPGRVLVVGMVLFALTNVGAFFVIQGKWTLGIYTGVIAIVVLAVQVSTSVFTGQFFPREKIGQFCSANSTVYRIAILLTATFAGAFFDWIKDYRYVFLWSAAFYLPTIPLYMMSHRNLMRTQRQSEAEELEASQASNA